jgi:hypothetical protein
MFCGSFILFTKQTANLSELIFGNSRQATVANYAEVHKLMTYSPLKAVTGMGRITFTSFFVYLVMKLKLKESLCLHDCVFTTFM